MIVDLTNIFSSSENITWLSIGHNSDEIYHEQFNLLLLFSKDKTMPVFFRVIDGAIRDISSIKKTIEESGVKNAVFVGDKGFFSEHNEETLFDNKIEHILPLRRNSTIINYDAANSNSKKAYDSFFFYNNRPIWHKTTTLENKKIILFFDEDLKADEAKSFLYRVNKKENSIDEFHEKEHQFGTIAVSVSCKEISAEKIFQYLKARMQIEVAFDTFKNILEADKTYMQSNEKLYGWMFVNFIALQMYYKIYGNLVNNNIIESFSPKDVAMHFSKVYRVKIGEKFVVSEIPKKTRILIEKMKLNEDILLK
ncbi:MAG: transposase [archaeon]